MSINRLHSIVIFDSLSNIFFLPFFLKILSDSIAWPSQVSNVSLCRRPTTVRRIRIKKSFKNYFRLVEWKWSLQGQKTTRGIGVYGPKMELSDLTNVSSSHRQTSAWVTYVAYNFLIEVRSIITIVITIISLFTFNWSLRGCKNCSDRPQTFQSLRNKNFREAATLYLSLPNPFHHYFIFLRHTLMAKTSYCLLTLFKFIRPQNWGLFQ